MHVGAEMPPEASGANRSAVTRPRPGHADLAGALKYGLDDMRDVLERASARETAARVAVAAVARQLLQAFHIEVLSHVVSIGSVGLPESLAVPVAAIRALPVDSPLHCVDREIEQQMIAAIDRAREAGDTLGGAFEVVVCDLPTGLGSHVQWDRKLDGRLAQALMSIPAIKAVGIGKGPGVASLPGSRIHDEIVPVAGHGASGHPSLGVARLTNNAGGLEGGVTNGEELRVTGFMKPIATLMQPLRSVDMTSLEPSSAAIERSDVCAVTAAAVVGEAMVALVVADAFVDKFGGDSLAELASNYSAYISAVRARFEMPTRR
jgi:chorismate synthase